LLADKDRPGWSLNHLQQSVVSKISNCCICSKSAARSLPQIAALAPGLSPDHDVNLPYQYGNFVMINHDGMRADGG
jgi:hypothetical protein